MMKKIFSTVVLIVAFAASARSQEMSPNAIGLKFGGGAGKYMGFGLTISYQKALSDENRAEFNLNSSSGSGYNYFGVGGVYQWVRNIEDGWNWYVGPGASIGSLTSSVSGDRFFLGVSGQIGIEYRFDFPLQLTLDANPYLGLLNGEGIAMPILLGVRYTF